MINDHTNPHKGTSEPVRSHAASPRPMTPKEAAGFLGLDDRTMIRWARQGYLPAHPMGEGKRKFWRFFEHELLAWLYGQSNGEVAA